MQQFENEQPKQQNQDEASSARYGPKISKPGKENKNIQTEFG